MTKSNLRALDDAMNAEAQNKQLLLFRLLTIAAILLLGAAYFSPVWWVSLKAPNYPEHTFPDGVRIHFHFDDVKNGCTVRESKEVFEEEALDCVEEMNTINHYVGMYPIATGGPVERALSHYVIVFFSIMLLAYLFMKQKTQATVLAVGFGALLAWMVTNLYMLGGLDAHVADYKDSMAEYFNEPEVIERWAGVLQAVLNSVIAVVAIFMATLTFLVWKSPRFSAILVLMPALLPVFFVLDYAGWLWFFGHNLHPWGAFTVKPFMPTVFGVGKVAQFSTYSYPHYGFGLLMGVFGCLLVAFLIRRKLQTDTATGPVSDGKLASAGAV